MINVEVVFFPNILTKDNSTLALILDKIRHSKIIGFFNTTVRTVTQHKQIRVFQMPYKNLLGIFCNRQFAFCNIEILGARFNVIPVAMFINMIEFP